MIFPERLASAQIADAISGGNTLSLSWVPKPVFVKQDQVLLVGAIVVVKISIQEYPGQQPIQTQAGEVWQVDDVILIQITFVANNEIQTNDIAGYVVLYDIRRTEYQ